MYLGTENPSNELEILATYICKVYAPVWFKIKCNPNSSDGAKNLWFLAKSTRYLPDKLKKIVDPVILRNGYFAHCENILICMINDNETTRNFAIQQIIKARKRSGELIRQFQIPKFDLNADCYTKMIKWNSNITEPPITKRLTINELKSNSIDFNFPCHTQAVERSVKVIYLSLRLFF